MAAAVGCCRCPADPCPRPGLCPTAGFGGCHLHRPCPEPSIIPCPDLAPPVCPRQGQQLKPELMKTAGHERAVQELIKGAEHSVFTARVSRQTGLETWSGKEENIRGYLEINLQLFHVLHGGWFSHVLLLLGFLVRKNTELCFPLAWEIIFVCTKMKCCT